jgi:cytoskeletal protein CcmA (bactofilin family)
MFTNTKSSDTPYPTDAPTPTPVGSTLAPQAATIIARGVKVEGEFKSQGDVVIEGDVQGIISTNGMLTVGPEAHIKADVTAEEAMISGTVDGNLNIKKQAVLHASARIKGDITAERVTVESGAAIEGKVQIGSPSMQASVKTNPEESKASEPKVKSEPSLMKPAPIEAPK